MLFSHVGLVTLCRRDEEINALWHVSQVIRSDPSFIQLQVGLARLHVHDLIPKVNLK